jgi:hypothetical protein
MRLFRRTARASSTDRVVPEFGVQVMLRKGDKIVRRDAHGAIRITQVTEDRVELTDLGRIGAPPTKPRRRG